MEQFRERVVWSEKDQERILDAFLVLGEYKLPVSAAYARYQEMLAAQSQIMPEVDGRYEVPLTCPKTADHIGEGRKSVLAPHQLWMGLSYELSDGQRKWFREFAGMTPSQTVVVDWVEVWPGTRHPRSFKIRSEQHIDPRNRSHVLVEFVVSEAGEFFRKSQEFSQELADQKVKDVTDKMGGRKVVEREKGKQSQKPATQAKTVDEYMKMLEGQEL